MRKCRYCKCEVPKRVNTPKTPDERVQNNGFCSIAHLLEHQKAKQLAQILKAQAKERRAAKKKKSTAEKDATNMLHKYIRERDHEKRCVTCDTLLVDSYDAGHFRSVGSAKELQVCPINIHGQCRKCNQGYNHKYQRDKRGTAERYESEARERLGNKLVDWLKGPHKPARLRDEDYRYLYKVYSRLRRHIKSNDVYWKWKQNQIVI